MNGDDAASPVGGAERLAATGLGLGRLAIGAGLWLAPQLASRALGFGSLDSKALALARIAASRDLVLGAWQLGSIADRDDLRRATAAAAFADGGDALAFALVVASGEHRAAGVRGLGAAVPASVAGAWLASRLNRR